LRIHPAPASLFPSVSQWFTGYQDDYVDLISGDKQNLKYFAYRTFDWKKRWIISLNMFLDFIYTMFLKKLKKKKWHFFKVDGSVQYVKFDDVV
jgi:hypothetical protein